MNCIVPCIVLFKITLLMIRHTFDVVPQSIVILIENAAKRAQRVKYLYFRKV